MEKELPISSYINNFLNENIMKILFFPQKGLTKYLGIHEKNASVQFPPHGTIASLIHIPQGEDRSSPPV